MRYTSRFVFWHYDEFDTTLASIYDILVETDSPSEALKAAEEILTEKTKNYSSPGMTNFISLTDESGVIYISSLSREGFWGVSLPIPPNGQLVVLSKNDCDKLPKSFCTTGETFIAVGRDKIP